jgi:acyl-CoA synthetase (NDP forming)
MIDSILPFIYFPPLKGRNVGIIGVGGGASVLAADECEREGLYVPPLAPEVRGRLREFTPVAGTSIANPIDTIEVFNPDNFKRTLELVGGWDEIHLLFCQLVIDPWRGEELINNLADCFIAVKKVIDKPVAAILQPVATPKGLQLLYTIQRKLIEAGIPVYPSFARAAKAVNNFLSYNLRG